MIFKRAAAKLRAQNWIAITIELAIVTLGVLIALATQQWADNRARGEKMDANMGALRDELAEHYGYAVEYRVVYPCLQAQLDRLRDRVLQSGATLNPAPAFQEEHFRYVLREPNKVYPTDAWQAAINDGTTQRLEPSIRRSLSGHYGRLPEIGDMTTANDASTQGRREMEAVALAEMTTAAEQLARTFFSPILGTVRMVGLMGKPIARCGTRRPHRPSLGWP